MPATPFDSAIYRDLLQDAEVASLFTDSAEIRAMLLVEGALASAQAGHGLIPELSGRAIARAAQEVLIDPAALTAETGQSAVVVPALVKAFRAAMQAPEHAQYIHWGATSQDIMDTGLILRLRQVVAIFEQRLAGVVRALGNLARAHADLPMAARTYAQTATVTGFGAVAASWGQPLLRHHARLAAMRDDLLCVSLSGAAGTLSAMGAPGAAIRTDLAKALNLRDPGGSWHSERDRIGALSGWVTGVAVSLGKFGEDLILLTQSGAGEVSLAQGGGSSTMPQKSNPVMPSLLVALARHVTALNTAIQGAGLHRQQRDGAAWITEWLTLPQLCQSLARGLVVAEELARLLTPNPDAMRAAIDDRAGGGRGLIYAEALSFALAAYMPRPEAQAAVKTLCLKTGETGASLAQLAAETWPEHDLGRIFEPQTQLGTAPAEARAFAKAAAAL
ncbi:MAG: adenylosuccinate lyase family protein [Rhodobacter sp.]|nr:adenylosuccinate lyase family protein [Rhodobacter sp.]